MKNNLEVLQSLTSKFHCKFWTLELCMFLKNPNQQEKAKGNVLYLEFLPW